MMQRFTAAGVSFVSVTQNFSKAEAMGRLTLNMLMSFAEFERSMISERTRDKIAASRRKGCSHGSPSAKRTGGPVPFGDSEKDKKLLVNEVEAQVVREAFTLFLQHR
jgi:site-specific DNA recombinase